MKIYEIGTGYTPIPARMGAATEIVVEELTRAFLKQNISVEIVDIASNDRIAHCLPIREVRVPGCFLGTDVQLGIMHKLKRVVYSIALAGELKKIPVWLLKNTAPQENMPPPSCGRLKCFYKVFRERKSFLQLKKIRSKAC